MGEINKNTKENLNEDTLENILLIAGFLPVIGEAADAALIIKYYRERRWIEAFIMLIALIPTVGDFIAKPFLALGRKAGAFASKAKFAEFLKTPAAEKAYSKMAPIFSSPKVNKYINDIKKVFPKVGDDMVASQKYHINQFGKLKEGVGRTALGMERKGLGSMVQQGFRRGALEKYIAKKGVAPSNWLSNWWNVVYKARRNRRGLVHKAIIGSNLLAVLGLPNIQSLENMMSTEDGAKKLMQNPEFNDFYGQVTTPQDEQYIEQESSSERQPNSSGSSFGLGTLLGGGLTINALKSIAKFV